MKYKIILVCLAISLCGCATQAELDARSIEDIDIAGKNVICVKQSLDSYSSCAGNSASFGRSSGAVISGLAACKSAYKVGVLNCPSE